MIRIFLVAFFLFLFLLFGLPILFVEWIIGKISPETKAISSLRIVQAAFKTILFISGTKTTVIGFENIPKDEPVLFIGNHRSYFDIVIAYSMMPRITGFIAKKEMNKIPALRIWMRNLYCLFLDRHDIKQGLKTILKGIDFVKKEKVSIVIFPEGTRNRDDDIKPFKEGSFKIAEKSGCKIIPMVQNNTDAVLEKHAPFIRRARTVIEFGTPIAIEELEKDDRKAIGAYVHKIVTQIYEKNKSL